MQPVTEHFIEARSGASIHCLGSVSLTNGSVLVIIPGNTNSAEEVLACLPPNCEQDILIISLRGRGKSTSSASDYSLFNQANDIADVIVKLNLRKCFLFGLSIGATIGIVAAAQIKERVLGFIIGDFAPYYPKYSEKWIQQVKNIKDKKITDFALERIAADSQYTDATVFYQNINCQKLLLHGKNNNSLLNEKQISKMTSVIDGLQVIGIANAGHEVLAEQPNETISAVCEFMRKVSDS